VRSPKEYIMRPASRYVTSIVCCIKADVTALCMLLFNCYHRDPFCQVFINRYCFKALYIHTVHLHCSLTMAQGSVEKTVHSPAS
jgi:hypothetical protein